VQEFRLAGPFAPPGVTGSETASFQIALDPSGRSLYAITQDTAATRDFQQGNAVHALSVAADGTLGEPNPVTTFSPADVPAAARLQGVAVVDRHTREGPDRDAPHGTGRHDALLTGSPSTAGSLFGTTPIGQGGTDSGAALSRLVDSAGGR
jgi:hypothetical protein